MVKKKQTAVIIGAGPAGLTAAYEFVHKTDIKPVVFESSNQVGGIAKTVRYKGNRIDIGGHRFFSKSDVVMEWWHNILPIEQTDASKTFMLKYQGKTRELVGGNGVDPKKTDNVMLVRSRMSRIYYGGKFYNYPVKLESATVKNLGFMRMAKIGVSYVKARAKPLPEDSLENFYVNRFGRELYNTFFRDYTEKLWGISPKQIAPDWGAQRVKGLSVTAVLKDAVTKQFKKSGGDISQKDTETSLIEHFLYPKHGPGQMWEVVTDIVMKKGGEVHQNSVITKLHAEKGKIVSVDVLDLKTNKVKNVKGDYFFSTMPVRELVESIDGVNVPKNVKEVADGLPYRDFMTVGLLAKKLKIKNETDRKTKHNIIPDNWLYIQEPGVKVGRIQVFNNWSPYLIKNPDNVWIGLEYFVNEGDELWSKKDKDMVEFAIDELVKIKVLDKKDVLDSVVIRSKKTYPAYFGTYNRFDEIRKFTDKFENLYLVGRNGQHRYNNQDHSMLSAMEAVENIRTGRKDKENVWSVNAEKEYHESK
ncbi:MAG TPA: NAD(P)/FAD-dependent oxidoreductase [Candidatus Saccharimonadales bacterium]|nr:NAD(P)/FAD-dependent oxidoreductase [Candidatus Saccharimonadales bacterium]